MLTPQCQSSTHKADAVSTPLPQPEPLGGRGALSLLTSPTSFTIQEVQTFCGCLAGSIKAFLSKHTITVFSKDSSFPRIPPHPSAFSTLGSSRPGVQGGEFTMNSSSRDLGLPSQSPCRCAHPSTWTLRGQTQVHSLWATPNQAQ